MVEYPHRVWNLGIGNTKSNYYYVHSYIGLREVGHDEDWVGHPKSKNCSGDWRIQTKGPDEEGTGACQWVLKPHMYNNRMPENKGIYKDNWLPRENKTAPDVRNPDGNSFSAEGKTNFYIESDSKIIRELNPNEYGIARFRGPGGHYNGRDSRGGAAKVYSRHGPAGAGPGLFSSHTMIPIGVYSRWHRGKPIYIRHSWRAVRDAWQAARFTLNKPVYVVTSKGFEPPTKGQIQERLTRFRTFIQDSEERHRDVGVGIW